MIRTSLDIDPHWRRVPTWIVIRLSETRIEEKTSLTLPEAVARVTAHMQSRYPGAHVEVTTLRKPAPYDWPEHDCDCNAREPHAWYVRDEIERAFRARS